jgi:hypothetical protein
MRRLKIYKKGKKNNERKLSEHKAFGRKIEKEKNKKKVRTMKMIIIFCFVFCGYEKGSVNNSKKKVLFLFNNTRWWLRPAADYWIFIITYYCHDIVTRFCHSTYKLFHTLRKTVCRTYLSCFIKYRKSVIFI